ncbi:ANTAR domain-containing protein [Actinomycetospora sp. TBRC 11914]|uniref:ANTAR domain-containing protein n=1 Tax=Actinomycetospora sp. TBRC 11914 TaxID=2729387 RepID=UPI00145DBDA3|nr:ANTAR domain-containing protein [Actinomycetospora sp. TBRC 11914]NMO88323.1 ANTAR domain-containing protein [Actinomycetospora sp. TBRC 11914]
MTRSANGTAVTVWSPEDDDDEDEFLAALLASAHAIAGCERVADALPRIAEGAVAVVPGVHDVGVAVRVAGELSCAAHTTETAAAVDRAQIGMAEGPCLDAIAGADTVVLLDAATETRWPRFVPEAVRHGVRASLSVRLATAGPAAALNLHLTQHALGDRSTRLRTRRRAQLLAVYASLALARSDRVEKLERAVVRRDVIGQAKGILMRHDGLDAEEAFERLRSASQTTNTKLYDVAAWLAARGAP